MLRYSYFIFYLTLIFAQTSDDLNPKAIKPNLLVDDGESMMTSYADANLIITSKYFELKERLNSRRWQGYQGNIKIAEAKFFAIAGFAEEARVAARYQAIRQTVFWSGAGMIFLGGLITVTNTEKSDNRWHFPALGIGLIATGISLDAIWYFAPSNRYPLGKALAAATEYNKRE